MLQFEAMHCTVILYVITEENNTAFKHISNADQVPTHTLVLIRAMPHSHAAHYTLTLNPDQSNDSGALIVSH